MINDAVAKKFYDQVEKKGFKHFMLKEIMEQPESIANTIRGRIKDEIKISIDFDIKDIKRIIITACGTSWHASLIGKTLIENITNYILNSAINKNTFNFYNCSVISMYF